MKTYKYDEAQVQKDYEYYKNRDKSNDASIYFMLKERYYMRARIAETKLTEALKQMDNEGEQK